MKNGNTKPIDTFVELGTQVIVRDKVFSQDASDVGFRRAVAGVSTFYGSFIIFSSLSRILMSPIKCSN